MQSIDLVGYTPDNFDWRDYQGYDWTTSINDQLACGSCYAFASIAALESVYKIENNLPNKEMDFSEQTIVSCGQKCTDMLGCCGGHTSTTLEFLKYLGVNEENYFPYEGRDDSSYDEVICHDKNVGWSDSLVKISNYEKLSSNTETIKNALITYGPLPTVMTVYEDFHGSNPDIFHYPNEDEWPDNIYYHKYGNLVGSTFKNHAVTIVGYNDIKGYWICKNSWGKSWGLTKDGNINNGNNGGWFRIKYNKCNINEDSYYIENVYKPDYVAEIDAYPEISWNNVAVNSILTGTFTIENIGTETIDRWSLKRYSPWGVDWSFEPSSGVNLKPDQKEAITVTVQAPAERNKQHYGWIKIYTDNCMNCDKLSADCKTSKVKYIVINDDFLINLFKMFWKNLACNNLI